MEHWIFVRHAPTRSNALGILGADSAEPLSPEGLLAAQALVETFRGQPFRAILSSPARRAQDTAAPIAKHLGIPVTIYPNLAERDLGVCAGMPQSEALAGPLGPSLRAWHPGPPGGESLRDAARRAFACIRLAQTAAGPGPLLIFSHAGVIRAVLGALEDTPLSLRGQRKIAHATPIPVHPTPAWLETVANHLAQEDGP